MDSAYFPAIVFFVGLFLGSLVNAVSYRLVRGKDWLFARSQCPQCGHTLSWYELVPLVSFVIQRGKCRACKGAISLRYPLVEIGTGFSLALMWIRFSPVGQTSVVYSLFFAAAWLLAAVIALYDAETKEIPLGVLGFLFVLGTVFQIWRNPAATPLYSFADTMNFMIADPGMPWRPMVVFAFFTIFFFAAMAIFRKESFGFGDVLIFTALSLFLTVAELLLVTIFSSFMGAAAGLGTLFVSRHDSERVSEIRQGIPFVPFIALGFLSVVLWGDIAARAYLQAFLP